MTTIDLAKDSPRLTSILPRGRSSVSSLGGSKAQAGSGHRGALAGSWAARQETGKTLEASRWSLEILAERLQGTESMPEGATRGPSSSDSCPSRWPRSSRATPTARCILDAALDRDGVEGPGRAPGGRRTPRDRPRPTAERRVPGPRRPDRDRETPRSSTSSARRSPTRKAGSPEFRGQAPRQPGEARLAEGRRGRALARYLDLDGPGTPTEGGRVADPAGRPGRESPARRRRRRRWYRIRP